MLYQLMEDFMKILVLNLMILKNFLYSKNLSLFSFALTAIGKASVANKGIKNLFIKKRVLFKVYSTKVKHDID